MYARPILSRVIWWRNAKRLDVKRTENYPYRVTYLKLAVRATSENNSKGSQWIHEYSSRFPSAERGISAKPGETFRFYLKKISDNFYDSIPPHSLAESYASNFRLAACHDRTAVGKSSFKQTARLYTHRPDPVFQPQISSDWYTFHCAAYGSCKFSEASPRGESRMSNVPSPAHDAKAEIATHPFSIGRKRSWPARAASATKSTSAIFNRYRSVSNILHNRYSRRGRARTKRIDEAPRLLLPSKSHPFGRYRMYASPWKSWSNEKRPQTKSCGSKTTFKILTFWSGW